MLKLLNMAAEIVMDVKDSAVDIAQSVRPGVLNWIGAAAGAAVGFVAGLSPLAHALLISQGADMITGIMCALVGKSHKSESGTISSKALTMGALKKGLEWLVVIVCTEVGAALGMESVGGAAMAYMIMTELVSLIENLHAFGLDIPILNAILDVARKTSGADEDDDDKSAPA